MIDHEQMQKALRARLLTWSSLPEYVGWENVELRRKEGESYVVEQYIPGPARQITVGRDGQLEVDPMYQVQVHVPEGEGYGTAAGYVDEIIALYAPGTAMTLDNGDILRVRTDTGPFRGQLQRADAGWVVVPVTIPCRLRTQNQIT